jgi:hypothetical protein
MRQIKMEVRKDNCISLCRDIILYDTYHLSLPAATTCHVWFSRVDYINTSKLTGRGNRQLQAKILTVFQQRLGSWQALLLITPSDHKNVCPVIPAATKLYRKAKLKFKS